MFLLRFISVRKLDKCQLIIFGEEVESDQRARPPTPSRGQANQNSWSEFDFFFLNELSLYCLHGQNKLKRTNQKTKK